MKFLTPITPVPMTLYPTMNSLDEVVELAKSKAPGISRNDLISLLMTYHNTLLKEIQNNRENHDDQNQCN